MLKQEYYQLITSLPSLQGKINSEFNHISRINFYKRLEELKPSDLQMIHDLEDFLIWEKKTLEGCCDNEFKQKVLELEKTYKNKTFQSILEFTTRKRIAIGLFRKRKNGEETAPSEEETWALSEIHHNIKNRWGDIDFGLKNIDKSLAGFDKLIQTDKSLELEKQLLQTAWDFCNRISSGHYFDIDYLLIYAVKRNAVDRWTIVHEPQNVTEKFNILAQEALNGGNKEEDI